MFIFEKDSLDTLAIQDYITRKIKQYAPRDNHITGQIYTQFNTAENTKRPNKNQYYQKKQ